MRLAQRMILFGKLVFPLILVPMLGGCQGASTPSAIPTATPCPTVAPPPTPTAMSPTPTPQAISPTLALQSYVSPTFGLSLSYPGDWLSRETETRVVFGTSQQVLAGGELTNGAGLAVYVEPLPDAEWQDVQETCADQASVFISEEMEIGAPQYRAIGAQHGALVTLQGTPALGRSAVRGVVAVAVWQDMRYTFVGLSVAEEWDTYGHALLEMIDAVEFVPREHAQFAPDPWEPDDALANAREIETASSQTHDLHTQGDRDCVRFQATRGHIYTIETASLGHDIDTRIFLYDHEGALLAQNDDGRAQEEPWASRLIWTAEKTNTLNVMVEDVGNDDAGPGTSYDITIWEEVHFVEDEYEPDDTAPLATLLKPGAPQPHNLHVPGDQDWLRFEALTGNTFIVETFDLGTGVDTALQVFDEQGNELAWNDNAGSDEEPLASRVQWRAQVDGSLYVMIHDTGDDAGGPGTAYWVRLLETRP